MFLLFFVEIYKHLLDTWEDKYEKLIIEFIRISSGIGNYWSCKFESIAIH